MPDVRIAAEPRTELGKGGARRSRRSGRVPAVLYGHGTAPRHLALPTRDFEHALRTDAGLNVLLHLDLGGSVELALPKALQRHPVRGELEHVDLLLVRRGEQVTVDVPVQVLGEVASGGLLDQQTMTLSVLAEATNIPGQFEVDVNGAEVGHVVHAKDVSLPVGVQLQADPEAVVLHVMATSTAEQFEAEISGAEAAPLPIAEPAAGVGDLAGDRGGAGGGFGESGAESGSGT